jgi:hypothetical protein
MQFTPFLTLLAEIEDPRRAEGKLYRLPHVVLFAILALVAGANSYRGIHSFIDVHFVRLRKFFRLKWRRTPAYTTIRNILRQLDPLRSSRRSAATPPSLTSNRPRRASGTSLWTARHCGKASTASRIVRPRIFSARLHRARPWSWRISTAMKSPTKSRRSRLCCANSGSSRLC